MQKLTLSIAILMTLVISLGYANTWYVKTDGDDANTGNSWENAKATIQAGIDAASDGDSFKQKIDKLKEAMNDELFLEDLRDISQSFKAVDLEEWE